MNSLKYSYQFRVATPSIDLQKTAADALVHLQAGRLAEAEAGFRTVLRTDPEHPGALLGLGLMALHGGDFNGAITLFRRALVRAPQDAMLWSNLGNALAMADQHADAAAAFEKATEFSPNLVEAWFNLGNVRYRLGASGLAEAAYRRALALDPGFVGAANNLANILALQERKQEAAEYFYHAGDAYADLGRLDDARNALARAYSLHPEPGYTVAARLLTAVIPQSSAAIDADRERLQRALAEMTQTGVRLEDPLRYASSAIYYSGYQGRNDRELKQAFARFYLSAHPELNWTAPHCQDASAPGPRLRIGFFSLFLHDQHPIGKHYGDLIRLLDRDRFEVTVFYTAGNSPIGDPAIDTLIAIPPHDLAATRKLVAAQRLDILFFTDIGMEPLTYFLGFSRLAPVQCVTLGHPVTTGLPNIDYFLSADVLETQAADAHYSEQLIRLRNISSHFSESVSIAPGPTREELGLSAQARLYVCGQNPIKFHPDFDRVLGDLLRRDPLGVLVVFHAIKTSQWSEQLHARLARAYPDVAQRIVFRPYLPLPQFLGFMQAADAVLDTPDFSGGTTTFESFAAGIPIVTWPGEFARSRPTYALYKLMGIDDLVARDANHYVEIAMRLAQDPAWRASLSARIAARRSVLYGNTEAVRELERFFIAATAAARQGKKIQQWQG